MTGGGQRWGDGEESPGRNSSEYKGPETEVSVEN